LVVFSLLVYSGSSRTDLFVRGAIWAVLLVLSATAITRMIRHASQGPYSQPDAMSKRWRSWVYDEPQEPRKR
jgi:hypothetical protein